MGFLAGHALTSDHGGVGVGQVRSVGEGGVGGGTVGRVGEDGTCVIGEETHVDGRSIIGTKGSQVVAHFFPVVVVIIVVVIIILLHLKLPTLGHLVHILLLLLFLLTIVFVIGVTIDTVLHILTHVKVVKAVVFVVAIITIVNTLRLVGGGVLTIVLLILLDTLEVGSEVGIQTNDVVSISRLTPIGIGSARVGRTETETHKCRIGHTYIVLVIGIIIPFGDVVTSLELEGVFGNPGEVDYCIIILEDTADGGRVVDTTSGGHEFLTNTGVCGDILGGCGGETDDGGEGGEGELHYFGLMGKKGVISVDDDSAQQLRQGNRNYDWRWQRRYLYCSTKSNIQRAGGIANAPILGDVGFRS